MTELLRWLSPEPAATVARLRAQFDAIAATEPRSAGPGADLRIELDRLTIEVVRADDRPNGAPADERLEFVPQSPAPAAGRDPSHSDRADGALLHLVALGWATVEIERFAADLGRLPIPCSNDVILGAFAARVAGDPPLVLLEPETEGRLVGSLAHWGEGPVALYVAAGATSGGLLGAAVRLRAGGVPVTPVAPGPFGPEVAIAGGPVRGPHLLVCEPLDPSNPGRSSRPEAGGR